jgi:hypothetical protein
VVETEYVYLACGFVLLAIIINLAIRFAGKDWIDRELKRGDLRSLVDVASGLRPDGLRPDQANRLMARGMVRVRSYGGHFRVTMKGRLALRIRQRVRRRSDSIT